MHGGPVPLQRDRVVRGPGAAEAEEKRKVADIRGPTTEDGVPATTWLLPVREVPVPIGGQPKDLQPTPAELHRLE